MRGISNVLTLTEGEELKRLEEITRAYGEFKLILEAVFESYTPYMGGGFDTSTLRQLQNGQVYITGFPTAKQVIGRMRWLAKIALTGRRGINSLSDAEKKPEVMVKVSSGTVKMGLLQALFGATPAQDAEKAWRSLVQVNVEPLISLSYKSRLDIVDEDLLAGQRGRRGPEPRLKNNRFALLSMGARSKNLVRGRKHLQILDLDWGGGRKLDPLRPGTVRFKLKLILDVGRLRRVILEDGRSLYNLQDAVSDFLALLALLIPTVFGIGKATTRGFGRFMLKDGKTVGSRAGKAIKLLKDLPKSCNNIHNCEDRYKRLLKLLDEVTEDLAGPANSQLYLAPSLKVSLNYDLIKAVWATLQVADQRRFSPISRAIEKIGQASMKQNWKKRKGDPGLNVHTWPLGLPRQQKFPKSCIDSLTCCHKLSRRRRNVRCHTQRPKLPDTLVTGYIILRALSGEGDNRRFPGSSLREVYCIKCNRYNVAANNTNLECFDAVDDVDENDLEEGRRQSMIIAFPAPFIDQVHRGAVPVVTIMLPADDFRRKLFQSRNVRLYHSGTCGSPTTNQKPCMAVLVDVVKAARFSGSYVFKVSSSKEGLKDEKYAKKGGVLRPNGSPDYIDISSLNGYQQVLKRAFEFFLNALRR